MHRIYATSIAFNEVVFILLQFRAVILVSVSMLITVSISNNVCIKHTIFNPMLLHCTQSRNSCTAEQTVHLFMTVTTHYTLYIITESKCLSVVQHSSMFSSQATCPHNSSRTPDAGKILSTYTSDWGRKFSRNLIFPEILAKARKL